jgi:hypothetical protein
MADFVLVDGDQVIFIPTFGPAQVVVHPGRLRATGPTFERKRMCVEADARDVAVAGCSYVTTTHTIPGVGTLKIDRLAPDQTSRTKYEGWRVLLRGSQFVARFEVQTPALLPSLLSSPLPDPMRRYLGSGSFLSSNWSLRSW